MSNAPETGILSEGDVLNNTYVISNLVASGGTGEVYRAVNRVSGREIAIKTLKREFAQDEQFIELMKREASVLHEVIDPAVVRYYDVLESDMHGGFLFLVMEFINGHSLADEMKQKGPLDSEILMRVAKRVLEGLKAAHDKKAFHRDLSPDNVILREGEPDQATLIDFGIAKDVNEGAKTVVGGGFAGKYQYASPEQMEGRADARSDLYSLGMTLIGAFRGQAPLQGSSMMEIVKAKAEKPDISDMSGPLAELVSRLVEPDADNRLQSADDALSFMASVGRAPATPAPAIPAEDKTVVAPKEMPPTTPPARNADAAMEAPKSSPKKERSGGLLWVAIALLLLGGGGAGAWWAGLFGESDIAAQAPAEAPEITVVDDAGVSTAPAVSGTGTDEVDPTEEVVDTAQPETPDQPETAVAELPLAVPFKLSVERIAAGDPIRLVGNLPNSDMLPTLQQQLQETFDSFAVIADVTPARGEPFEGWAEKVSRIAMLFAAFDTFTVAAEANDVVLIADAENEAEKTAILAAAWQIIEGSGLNLVDRIAVAPPQLTIAMLAEGVQPFETCGRLQVSGGTGGVLGPNDAIKVQGYVAAPTDRTRIAGYFGQNAPGRALETDTQVVNQGVCNVLSALPNAADGGMSVDYSYGTKDGAVAGDTYLLGENPVIDIVLPADQSGYIHVAFADLAEQVFHLLPHQARTGNLLSEAGTVEGDKRRVRVAFPISEASIQQLGFKVVEPLGTNIVLAIVTQEPLFDELRPRAESNGAFVDALSVEKAKVEGAGGLMTWRFLRTEP